MAHTEHMSEIVLAGDETSAVAGESMALEQVRMMRRLLVIRCGVLVILAALGGALVHGLTLLARCGSIVLVATPPILAWIIEIRLARRLGRRFVNRRKS